MTKTLKQVTSIMAVLAVTIIIALLVSIPNQASAQTYVKIEAGMTGDTEVSGIGLADDETFGAAIGRDFGLVRAEIGANRITADTFGVGIAAVDYHATAFVDFDLTARDAIFVGAGVDYIQAEADFGFGSIDGEGEGWHYVAGYSRKLSETVTFEAAYRHVEAEIDMGFGSELSAETDLYTVGVRFAL